MPPEITMVSSRTTALFSALALCAGAATAQGLSSGTTSGGIAQGTLRPGQPALQAPTTPPQAATPTPSASTPLPGQSTMPQQLPPLNSNGVGGQAAIAAPPGSVPTRSSTAAEAFSMLDRGGLGYVTRADTDRIPGLMGFDNADTNRDGQLSKEEFATMWRSYSGQ
jgi:EF hand domain-containing protein